MVGASGWWLVALEQVGSGWSQGSKGEGVGRKLGCWSQWSNGRVLVAPLNPYINVSGGGMVVTK